MKKSVLLLAFVIAAFTANAQKVTNTWDGSYNYYWHNANNWSLNHIPTSTEDVVIPNGMPRYPSVSSVDEVIKSLYIASNAYVKIGANKLHVNNDVDVYGEIRMINSDAKLYTDDITWYSGSSATTTGSCTIYVNGIWEFASGADVQLDHGIVCFMGSGDNFIRSKDADCYFFDVWVNKTNNRFALSSQSTATCKIKQSLSLYGSNYNVFSYSAQTIQIGLGIIVGNPTINVA